MVVRLESARLSLRPGRKLQASMIGQPENDLRHIGHVGYDGVTFGDVSFIGDDYSKLQPLDANNASKNNGNKREFSSLFHHYSVLLLRHHVTSFRFLLLSACFMLYFPPASSSGRKREGWAMEALDLGSALGVPAFSHSIHTCFNHKNIVAVS